MVSSLVGVMGGSGRLLELMGLVVWRIGPNSCARDRKDAGRLVSLWPFESRDRRRMSGCYGERAGGVAAREVLLADAANLPPIP
jgi:hypothetical protein